MRNLIAILLLLPQIMLGQQNLVVNGSFEENQQCPGSPFQWTVLNWGNANGLTPDYYHTCGLVAPTQVPANWHGYQFPYDGEAYVGLWTFSLTDPDIGREYIQTELSEPLFRRIRYKVSFYASLGERYGGYAISTLGAALTVEPPDTALGGWLLDAEPQILNDPLYPITDTANWVLITDTIMSLIGGERYLTIGNFSTDVESDTLLFNPAAEVWRLSYYYIDDVSVIALDSVPDGIAEQEELGFELWPNPAKEVLKFKVEGSTWQADGMTVRVLDAVGRPSIHHPLVADGTQDDHTIDVSGLPSGMYFLELRDEEGRRAVRRFVRE